MPIEQPEQEEYDIVCLNCNEPITNDNVECTCQYCSEDCCDSCLEEHEYECENPDNEDYEGGED